MIAGTFQQVIQQFRAQLLAHEAQAETILEHAYQHTLAQLQPRLDALYQQMSDAQANLGEDEQLPLSWLYEADRLQAVKSLIEQQVNHFGTMAEQTTAQLQHFGVTLGGQAGQALLNASLPAGVNYTFGVPDLRAIANLVGATQAVSPLADLFNGFGAEAAKGASQALITGVTLGHNPRQIAPAVQQALGVSRNRALVVSRTEMLRAYRSSSLEAYRANSDVVSQWRWTCALSTRSCPACLAMDGTLHDLDEELDEHPCGRCSAIPVTKGWEEILGPLGIDTSDIPDTSPIDDMQSGSEWFANQSAEVQKQILGPGKFAAFQDGKFQLADVVGHSHDKQWGSSIYERSLADTLKAAENRPVVPELPKLSETEQRLKDLEDSMNAKYPQCRFDYAGCDPAVMEHVNKEIDSLFTRYPDVAVTMPYIGTGANMTDEMKRFGYNLNMDNMRTVAYIQNAYLPSMSTAFSPMFLNTKYFGDVDAFNSVVQRLASKGWLAAGSDTGGIEYIIAHEFGHAVNFYLEQNGRGWSFMNFINATGNEGEVADATRLFMRENSKLGDKISEYAKTNDREKFAEAFASFQFAPASQQATYTKRLRKFLEQVLPDGSRDSWDAPTPGKWDEAQFDAWNAFFDTYIKGK